MDKIDPGPGYRLLERGVVFEQGDEVWHPGELGWQPLTKGLVGRDCQGLTGLARRKLPTVAPAPGSPEDQASLAELDALIPPVPVSPGWRLLEEGEWMPPGYQWPDPSGEWHPGHVCPNTVQYDSKVHGPCRIGADVPALFPATQSPEVWIRVPWPSADECRRSLEAAGIKPEDFAKSPGATILQQDFQTLEEKIYGTLASLGLLHLLPRPFTPNKYTRELLSLDGRRVPVDVYSVSGAFALAPVIQNEEALDALFHARKKILAPGQRGAKDVLQDLKEARQSLSRAIAVLELEAGA